MGTLAYSQYDVGIFSCQANGYESDRYLANCDAGKYGDYDHGAFWFDLDPAAISSASKAEVVFLGNSRMQFGFSSDVISNWFSSNDIKHYLMGFAYNGNYKFEGPLLRKIGSRAKVYIINVDLFFEKEPSRQANLVMHDKSARARDEEKRRWQWIHRKLCSNFPGLCGDNRAFFRSRTTGDWLLNWGQKADDDPVSYSEDVDQKMVGAYIAAGKEFLATLPVSRDCIIFTMVPHRKTPVATARAIAAGLDVTFVAPRFEDLTTFDKSHLDRQSSERWSAAFIKGAGSRILSCMH